MLEKSIRTDTKKRMNQRRALFQNNTIKMGKMKKELSKDFFVLKDPQEKPSTIRNMKGSFFNINNNFSVKSKNDFTPKQISSKRFQQEVINDIVKVDLFGGAENSIDNKPFSNTSPSHAKKPFKLNPLKVSSRIEKKVLKIDDFILLESELPHIFTSDASKLKLSSQQLNEFNKQLLQELKKLNLFEDQTPKNEVASFSKKLVNKKAYKTYDKVLGDKFKLDFLTNKMTVRKNNLKEKMRTNTNSNSRSKSKSKEDSFTYKTSNSLGSVKKENLYNVEKNKDKNLNRGKNLLLEINENNRVKKTYLTAFDALDSINNLDFSDGEGNGNHLSKNIKNKLERFSKHIQTENSQSNTSIEHLKDKKKSSPYNNRSRGSSENSQSRVRAKSNSVYNTINNNHSSLGNLSSKSPRDLINKNDKSFLDNYIRLPKIVVSKINVNHNTNRNSEANNHGNYVQNEVVLGSKQLLKGFNKTKKLRNNLDSLVSKISYKIGNGFPLKKFVTDYDSFSNVYPKKNFAK